MDIDYTIIIKKLLVCFLLSIKFDMSGFYCSYYIMKLENMELVLKEEKHLKFYSEVQNVQFSVLADIYMAKKKF